MNPRTTALLFLAVAALGGFVYLYEIRGGQERALAEGAAKRLFLDLEASAVESFELRTSDGKQARAERLPEGGWRLREPRDAPGDAATLDAVADALVQLESEAVFEEPAPLEDYGLAAEPTLRFRVGESEHVLRVGDKTPIGGNTYVATESDALVYAVASYRTNALRKRLEDLQDKRVLRFDPTTVMGLDLRWPGGGIRLAREGEGWQLAEPIAESADTRTVEDLISSLSFLRASGFLADPPPDRDLGLEDPAFTARVELAADRQGGEPRQVELAVGSNLDGENRVVRTSAEETLRYSIPADRLEDWPRRVGAYRFKELARFEASQARRLELVFQDPAAGQSLAVTAQRGEGGWQASPEPIAPAKLETLVARLATLRAADVMASGLDEMGLAALGLAPPTVSVQVFGEESDPPLAEVHIGLAAPGKGIAAQRPDRDSVFWLDYDLAEEIPVSLAALRNRFLAEPEPEPEPEAEAAGD